MFLQILLAAALSLFGATAHAELKENDILESSISSCALRKDAAEIVASMEAVSLFRQKLDERLCATFSGVFVVLEIVEKRHHIWMLKIGTSWGDLYGLYAPDMAGTDI